MRTDLLHFQRTYNFIGPLFSQKQLSSEAVFLFFNPKKRRNQ
ncbi:hypothetical protein R078131_01090 [Convivina intestini]|nr:hypothetical protein R078131_01090 [Convivina intestini]